MTITITTDRSTLDTNNPVTDRDYQAYCEAIRERVEAKYPDAEIEFVEGPHLHSGVQVFGDDNYVESVRENVIHIVRTVSEAGTFWN